MIAYRSTFMLTAVGEEAFETAWAEGGAMTFEQAVAYALDEDSSVPSAEV